MRKAVFEKTQKAGAIQTKFSPWTSNNTYQTSTNSGDVRTPSRRAVAVAVAAAAAAAAASGLARPLASDRHLVAGRSAACGR